MIICIPVVESDADIEFVFAEFPVEIIVKRNHIEIFPVKLQVFFKRAVLQKDRIEFSVVFQANAMIDQYPAASCVFKDLFVKS